MPDFRLEAFTCPVPVVDRERILLGHGGGGQLSADLLRRVFLPALGNDVLNALEDQAVVRFDGPAADRSAPALPRLALTTDAFVVQPLFFPGGDIARLAVNGTVNDLAVGGAEPRFLTASFLLEEGLEIDVLRRLVASFRAACDAARVTLVTADTKVVDRGKADQLFITTTGIGLVPDGVDLSIHNARPGDRLLVSGTIGDHGAAIMSVREGIEFETALESDTAPLTELTRTLLASCPALRAMRDPTRGGLSSTLHELAEASRVGVKLNESAIPLRSDVRAACEMLGLDPLCVANEGKLVAVVPAEEAEQALAALRRRPLGANAAIIGEVTAEHPGIVTQRTTFGGERIVPLLAGEQLPRIC